MIEAIISSRPDGIIFQDAINISLFVLYRHKREGCILSVRFTQFHFSPMSAFLGFGCFHISVHNFEANKVYKLHIEVVIKNKHAVCRE